MMKGIYTSNIKLKDLLPEIVVIKIVVDNLSKNTNPIHFHCKGFMNSHQTAFSAPMTGNAIYDCPF